MPEPRRACCRSSVSSSSTARLRGSPTALDGAESAEVATAAVAGVEALEGFFGRYLPQLVLAVVVPVAVLVLVASLDLVSAGLMLLTLPLVPVFFWLIGRSTAHRARERWQTMSLLATHFLDVVRGLPTLRAFNRGEAQAERIEQASDEYRRCDDGHATARVPLRHGARAGSDTRRRARRGHGRRSTRRRRNRVRAGADGARAGTRAVPAAPKPGRRVPCERRRRRGRGPPARVDRAAADRAPGARPLLRACACADPVRVRLVRVSRPAGLGARRGRARARARRDGRARRAERRRQEHPRVAAPALPRADARAGSSSATSTLRRATPPPGGGRSPGCRRARPCFAARSPTTSASAPQPPRTSPCARRQRSPARTRSSRACRRLRRGRRRRSPAAVDRRAPAHRARSRLSPRRTARRARRADSEPRSAERARSWPTRSSGSGAAARCC